MELRITYKQMASSPAIEETITKKITKLKKYYHGKIKVDWKCSSSSEGHRSDVSVIGENLDIHATSIEDDFYKTIDQAIDKLKAQLAKRNEQDKSKIHRDSKGIKDIDESES